MFETLTNVNDLLPYAKWAAVLIGLLLVVITIACLTYVVKSTFRPLLVVMQWTVAHTPGEQPGEIMQGISIGARMLFLAGVIGLVVWVVFH